MIIYILTLFFCGAIFIGFGIFALRKQTPIHFWAGTIVKSEQITDVKSYNRANGVMWITYGLLVLLTGLPAIFLGLDVWAVVFASVIFLGLIVMMVIYNKIYNKYKV